ncbi:MAG: hypothetical protein WBD20_14005 [Pirellulaceae bacterium]
MKPSSFTFAVAMLAFAVGCQPPTATDTSISTSTSVSSSNTTGNTTAASGNMTTSTETPVSETP